MTLQETINEVFAKHDAECLLLTKQRDEARQEIKLLRKERDEARREVCDMSARTHIKQAYEYSQLRGWDCYKNHIGNHIGNLTDMVNKETP